MKKLILHIGTEKTGSTSVQDFVYRNRAKLNECGVALCDTIGAPNNQKIVAYFQNHIDDYLKDRQIYNDEEKRAYFADFEQEVAEELQSLAQTGKTVFITSELFHSRLLEQSSIHRLKKFLRPFFDEIKIICYLREQSNLAISLYSTTVKAGNHGGLDEFLQNIEHDSHYYNYNGFLQKWENVFGGDALRVKLFDRDSLIEGDILRDISHEILPAAWVAELDFDMPASNESLGPVGIELGRTINQAYPRYRKDGSINHFRWELINFISNSHLCKSGKLSNPNAAKLFDMFQSSNTEVARRFFNRDGNLFKRPETGETLKPAFSTEDEWRSTIQEFFRTFLTTVLSDRIFEKRVGPELLGIANSISDGSAGQKDAIRIVEVAAKINPDGEKIRAELARLQKEKKLI